MMNKFSASRKQTATLAEPLMVNNINHRTISWRVVSTRMFNKNSAPAAAAMEKNSG